MARWARKVLGIGAAVSVLGCSGGSAGTVSVAPGGPVSSASATATDPASAAVAKLPCPPANIAPSLLRESRRVEIEGREECWALAWETAPTPICAEGDRTWYCALFPEGQEGDLDVIRTRAGAEAEIVRVRGALPGKETMAVLKVFGHQGTDSKAMRLLNVRDFDRDGRETEVKLVLRPGDALLDETRRPRVVLEVPPNQGYRSIVIGLPPRSSHLAAIGAASEPGIPLVLPREDGWNQVIAASEEELSAGLEWTLQECKGEGIALSLLLRAGRKGIVLEQRRRSCACGAEGCTWRNQPVLGTGPWPGRTP